VEHRPSVRGKVTDPKASVWVVVRPMSTSDYWVQPRVDIDVDGSWSTQVYIGESPSANAGETFKIRAIANPRSPLHEGDRLRDWPEAQFQSRMIEVVKR
jgi:hypothetical protein